MSTGQLFAAMMVEIVGRKNSLFFFLTLVTFFTTICTFVTDLDVLTVSE